MQASKNLSTKLGITKSTLKGFHSQQKIISNYRGLQNSLKQQKSSHKKAAFDKTMQQKANLSFVSGVGIYSGIRTLRKVTYNLKERAVFKSKLLIISFLYNISNSYNIGLGILGKQVANI